MQNKLQILKSYKILFLSALLMLGTYGLTAGQVVLQEESPLEVRFAKENSQVTRTQVTLSLSDLSRYLEVTEPGDWKEFDPEDQTGGSFYISDDGQYISAGNVDLAREEDQDFFAISFRNGADFGIGGLTVSFDFVYSPEILQQNHTMSLYYRVNNEQWKRASGGTIHTGSLGRSEQEWDTFSIHLNLDQIFLRHDDVIEMKWKFERAEELNAPMPLAMQRVEAYPRKSVPENISRGSLIITEILPTTTVDDMNFEYLEIYNPGDIPISLKGMEMNTTQGYLVIQQNVEIAPYGVLVLSNVDISGFEGISNNYVYDGNLISEEGGRIELKYHGNPIAGATYEATEPGTALELDKAINAFDGYTSLQNLMPSETTFFPELQGTPGNLGRTVPIYKKALQKEGWYFITPPGAFIDRLTRSNSLDFYNLEGERISLELVDPHTPVFIKKNDSNPVTIYVEDAVRFNRSEIDTKILGRNLLLASFQKPINTNLGNLTRNGDEALTPIVTVWDDHRQTFKMEFTERNDLLNWSPFMINPSLGTEIGLGERSAPKTAPQLDRLINFRLFEGSSNNKRLADEAILGFLNQSVNQENIRYDLPKLTASFQQTANLNDQTYLYMSSSKSSAAANSFVHLPYEIDQNYQVGLGYELNSDNAREASLEWDLTDEIPDEWVLTLEDTYTGSTVDMREVNNYRFRFRGSAGSREINDDFSGLTVLEPSERHRFIVNLEPYEAIIEEEEEEERPGTVELRQNYPNPFNPATNITFYLPEERPVRVGVYNIVGQQVSLLIDETMQAGEHSVIWDATNNPSGIYIVQLETGNRILTRKITLIK
jgi:hypothetical protein